MTKILFILINIIFTVSLLEGYEFQLNKYQLEYLKKNNPEILEKYQDIEEKYKKGEKDFAIFLFTSSSVPINYSEIYAKTIHNTNINNGIFFNGLNKETYKYIENSIKKIENKSYEKNLSFMFDPNFFTNNNLKKVPALSLSLCNKGNYYPSECETLFLIHGTSNVDFFINKIIEKNEDYANFLLN